MTDFHPHSQQPRPHDAARGVRPGRHEPGLLHGFVALQHQVWIDRHGVEWEIEVMPLDYAANVIAFCHQRAETIKQITQAELLMRVLDHAAADNSEAALEAFDQLAASRQLDLHEWLEQTPLLLALRRRLDQRRISRAQ